MIGANPSYRMMVIRKDETDIYLIVGEDERSDASERNPCEALLIISGSRSRRRQEKKMKIWTILL